MIGRTWEVAVMAGLLALTGCAGGGGESASETATEGSTESTAGTGESAGETAAMGAVIWELSPAIGPAARSEFSMTALGDKIVLFGGDETNTSFFGDTWIFDGEAWTELQIPGPEPRGAYGLTTWDGAVWLYGGVGRPEGGSITSFADLWRFDGRAWTRIEENAAPGPRQSFVFVGTDAGLVLSSGLEGLSYRTDAWRYDGAWTQIAEGPGKLRSMGSTQRGGVGYVVGGASPGASATIWSTDGLEWTAEATPLPFGIAYPYTCPLGQFLLTFGGIQTSTDSVAMAALWGPGGAIEVAADPSPRSNGGAAMLGDRCVIFGGAGEGMVFAETWIARLE